MALPYTLVEKSVLRKPNSDKSIGDVLTETAAWLQSLQEGTSVANFFYYAEVIDSDTKARYFVYSVEAQQYFGLPNNIVEADSVSLSGGVSLPTGGTAGQILTKSSDVDGEAEWVDNGVSGTILKNSTRFGHYQGGVTSKPAVGAVLDMFRDQDSRDTLVLEGDDFHVILKKGNRYSVKGGMYLHTASSGVTNAAWKIQGVTSETIYDIFGSHDVDYDNAANSFLWRDFEPYFFIEPEEDVKLTYVVHDSSTSGLTALGYKCVITEESLTDTNVAVEAPGYSEEEVLTERRWVDGKPIYRAVSTNAPLTMTDAEQVINTKSITQRDGTPTRFDTDDVYVSADAYVYKILENNVLSVMSAGGLTSSNYVLIAEYTKTTDTAESPVSTSLMNIMPKPIQSEDSLDSYSIGKEVSNIAPFKSGARTVAAGIVNTDGTHSSTAKFNISSSNKVGAGVFRLYFTNPIDSSKCIASSEVKAVGWSATDMVATLTDNYIQVETSATNLSKDYDFGSVYVEVKELGDFGLTGYSETEVSTGKTWVDGKMIYRKTFTNLVGPGAGEELFYNHNISSVDNFTDISYIAKRDSDGLTFGDVWNVEVGATSTQIKLFANSDVSRSAFNFTVTLEYTKN